MQADSPTRVAVAITANGGNTLCGFRTTTSPRRAGRMFASSVSRLRRVGPTDQAPVVMSIDTASETFESVWEAEREFERALDLAATGTPTAEHAFVR